MNFIEPPHSRATTARTGNEGRKRGTSHPDAPLPPIFQTTRAHRLRWKGRPSTCALFCHLQNIPGYKDSASPPTGVELSSGIAPTGTGGGYGTPHRCSTSSHHTKRTSHWITRQNSPKTSRHLTSSIQKAEIRTPRPANQVI